MKIDEIIFGLYYPGTREWFSSKKGQVFVMNLSDANHLRRVLGKETKEVIQVKRYDGENSIPYEGKLLEFER